MATFCVWTPNADAKRDSIKQRMLKEEHFWVLFESTPVEPDQVTKVTAMSSP